MSRDASPDSGKIPGLEQWEPLKPDEAGALCRDYPGFWCVGGWAIDLYAGGQSRAHADIDLVIDRADLPILHRALPGWLLYGADGVLRPWVAGTALPTGAHDIWCRRPGRQWELQFMVGEFTDTEWIFRRDERIRGPRERARVWIDGLPVLAPEIQLLYKSKPPFRPKDEHDFGIALPHLSPGRRDWLAAALTTLYEDHPWLAALEKAEGLGRR